MEEKPEGGHALAQPFSTTECRVVNGQCQSHGLLLGCGFRQALLDDRLRQQQAMDKIDEAEARVQLMQADFALRTQERDAALAELTELKIKNAHNLEVVKKLWVQLQASRVDWKLARANEARANIELGEAIASAADWKERCEGTAEISAERRDMLEKARVDLSKERQRFNEVAIKWNVARAEADVLKAVAKQAHDLTSGHGWQYPREFEKCDHIVCLRARGLPTRSILTGAKKEWHPLNEGQDVGEGRAKPEARNVGPDAVEDHPANSQNSAPAKPVRSDCNCVCGDVDNWDGHHRVDCNHGRGCDCKSTESIWQILHEADKKYYERQAKIVSPKDAMGNDPNLDNPFGRPLAQMDCRDKSMCPGHIRGDIVYYHRRPSNQEAQ